MLFVSLNGRHSGPRTKEKAMIKKKPWQKEKSHGTKAKATAQKKKATAQKKKATVKVAFYWQKHSGNSTPSLKAN